MQYGSNKLIYRRYAGLFFTVCVDASDNELACLEFIHLFVEILDHYFNNVRELDLVYVVDTREHARTARTHARTHARFPSPPFASFTFANTHHRVASLSLSFPFLSLSFLSLLAVTTSTRPL